MEIFLAFVLILFFHSEVPLSGDPFRYKGRLEMTTEYFPVHVLSHVSMFFPHPVKNDCTKREDLIESFLIQEWITATSLWA